jgi:hypothetical protein
MSANVLFVVMILFSAIALLIAFISATIAASNLKGSPSYSTNVNIRDAYGNLTIAAVLGGASFAILIVIMVITAFTGGFDSVSISEDLLKKPLITKDDLVLAYGAERQLSSGHTTQIIIIVFLIIIGIITLIIGIFCVMAAITISNLTVSDANINNAYTSAVVASVAGVGGIGLMIVAIITYIIIRNSKMKKLSEVEDFTDRAEGQHIADELMKDKMNTQHTHHSGFNHHPKPVIVNVQTPSTKPQVKPQVISIEKIPAPVPNPIVLPIQVKKTPDLPIQVQKPPDLPNPIVLPIQVQKPPDLPIQVQKPPDLPIQVQKPPDLPITNISA